METQMLNEGSISYYYYRDAAFRDMNPIYGHEEVAARKAFNRDQVNEQIRDLLWQNGIQLPQGTSLTFTIDPNNFRLAVSGLDNPSLLAQVENILNTGNNSKELFFHIMQNRPANSSQFTKAKIEKFHLVNQIRNVTGYELRDLEIKNGKFITPDGKDLYEVYRDALNSNPYTKSTAGMALSHYGPQLHELAKNGFYSIPDLFLSIHYEDGALHDI